MYLSISYLVLLLVPQGKPTIVIHGVSPSFCIYCDSNTSCLTSQTLTLESITILQERPTVLSCYGTEFLLKPMPFHFKAHMMTSKINKRLMCYILVVRKEQIKNCYKKQLYFFNGYSFACWLGILLTELPYSHDSVIKKLWNSIVYPGQVNKWGQNIIMAFTFHILCVLSQINRLDKCYSICILATNIVFDF